MPPKTKKQVRKKNIPSDTSSTQPRLNFQLPPKDPIQQSKKLFHKIQAIRVNMAKLKEEEDKYMRQFLKNQKNIKCENSHSNQINENDQSLSFTMQFSEKSDILDVILGKFAISSKQQQQLYTKDDTDEQFDKQQTNVPQIQLMKPQFLCQYEPGFMKTLSQLQIQGTNER